MQVKCIVKSSDEMSFLYVWQNVNIPKASYSQQFQKTGYLQNILHIIIQWHINLLLPNFQYCPFQIQS